MLQRLTAWIKELKRIAEVDEDLLISWFEDTKDSKFSIIGGWSGGFSEDYANLLHISKSNPSYAMCVKIAINEGPYEYTDFEVMNEPLDENNEPEGPCIALELDDDPAELALFIASEWVRITKKFTGEDVA